MLYDTDIRKQWDTLFKQITSFAKGTEPGEDYVTWEFLGKMMVSTRDFVVKRRMAKDYKGYDFIFVMNSEEHPDKPK